MRFHGKHCGTGKYKRTLSATRDVALLQRERRVNTEETRRREEGREREGGKVCSSWISPTKPGDVADFSHSALSRSSVTWRCSVTPQTTVRVFFFLLPFFLFFFFPPLPPTSLGCIRAAEPDTIYSTALTNNLIMRFKLYVGETGGSTRAPRSFPSGTVISS